MKFKVIKNTDEVVLIEVIFEDKVDQMSNEGFTGFEKYIKHTKGENQSITLYDSNYSPFCNFSFGEGNVSPVSEDLKTLKNKVQSFMLTQHIQVNMVPDDIQEENKMMPPRIRHNDCVVYLGGKFTLPLKTEKQVKELYLENMRLMNRRNSQQELSFTR